VSKSAKHRTVVVAAVLAIGLVAAVFAFGSDSSGPEREAGSAFLERKAEDARQSAPPRARTAHPKPREKGPYGKPREQTYPARIIGDPDPFCSSDTLSPLVNGWSVSNHRRFTAVQAGGNMYDDAEGVFCIFRQNFIAVTQRVKVVRVDGAGELKIIDAPAGRGRVQTRAQKRGRLRFRGTNGVTGTLRLRNDTVILDS
jgi:hypothetical protein